MAAEPLMERPDFAALRNQLLQQAGYDPIALAGLQDSYLVDTNNLYQQLAQAYLGLGTEETDVETGYEREYGDLQRQEKEARQRLQDQMAFRGMLQSSAYFDQEGKLGEEYGRSYSDLGTNRTNSLADIAARRLAARSNYDVGLGTAKLGLGGAADQYTQQMAEKAAKSQNALDAAQGNAGVTDVQTQIQQGISKALQNYQMPDLSQFANLFVQNTPTAATTPAPPKAPITASTGYKPPMQVQGKQTPAGQPLKKGSGPRSYRI